jgi:methanol metabolism-related c-type cytochrome
VNLKFWKFGLAVAAGVLAASVLASGVAFADGSGDPAIASSDNGKYMDKDGNPTYKISPDGMVDWYTFSGFRRYHSDCHVCHGPNGEGSTYAPALANSLKTLSYSDFANVVTNGRQHVDAANDKVMPSFASNVNVMCYLDDIYVYLRARANDAIPGGRPPTHEDKSEAAKQAEASCTGIK